jgi:hypothetical protein
MTEYVFIVRRKAILPRLLSLFLFFCAYNALRLGFASGSPIHGFSFALLFLAAAFVFAFPGKVAFVIGAMCGLVYERARERWRFLP